MPNKSTGFALIDMLISLVILLTLTQLLVCFSVVLIKQAKHSEAVFNAQVQAENFLELKRANVVDF